MKVFRIVKNLFSQQTVVASANKKKRKEKWLVLLYMLAILLPQMKT